MTQGTGGTSSKGTGSMGTGSKGAGKGTGRPLSDAELDRMVDAYFDRELSTGQRRAMFDQLSGQGNRCEDIARMQRILAQLREPPETIDVAGDVIAQISTRRGFLSPRMRAAVRMGRMAVAASVLLALLGIVVVQRIAPDATMLVAEPTPVTSLMQETGRDLSRLRTSLAGASEQAAIVLLPGVVGSASEQAFGPAFGLAFGPEVAIGSLEVRGSGPGSRFPAAAPLDLVVLSSAGDNDVFAAHWFGQKNDGAGTATWYAHDADLEWSRGFRTVESGTVEGGTVLAGLASRAEGERARVVPYYVEHFEVGDLPVSIDPEACRSVLRLISRKSQAIGAMDNPDRK